MNGRIRFPYRLLLVALTIFAASSGILFSTPAAGAGPSLAGGWHVMYYLRCSNAVQYAPACEAVGQIKLPVVTDKRAVLVAQRSLDIVSDARGRFTFQSRVVTVQQASGGTQRCNTYQEETGTLTGICEMVSHGKGHIAKGKTGLLDFWMEQRTTVYRGHHTYQITRSSTLDTLTPATPGSWDTVHLVSLHGYPTAPPGFVFRLSVMHDLSITTATVTVT
jgi:hypothetical protein